jgi:hypothetical protein
LPKFILPIGIAFESGSISISRTDCVLAGGRIGRRNGGPESFAAAIFTGQRDMSKQVR